MANAEHMLNITSERNTGPPSSTHDTLHSLDLCDSEDPMQAEGFVGILMGRSLCDIRSNLHLPLPQLA